ncbi:iron-siderophore ABC transporter substrate-binding protein [Novisyntrophococcus fermenticellae]|uniref:iron-siderophore ABC transporter substrate-binding protein n=1 Tax=Novisyntrophococcus fermenticellae TaxID=2068655 RepID=UPI001E479C27|nr:iron-siderophore ABC transporter substrate-binding protein [Novisyntrophococcus fermenticellae]
MKIKTLTTLTKSVMIASAALLAAGCSNTSSTPENKETPTSESTSASTVSEDSKTSDVQYPITLKHALGETVIEEKPERVATISWGNQDVALSLGVVPVGVSEANYGVTDGTGLLPWTNEKFKELGVDAPVIFHDTDGLDYEAISDANPDIILAGYSGITQEEYDLLSQIAPVVAYTGQPWVTSWRDQILIDSKGMGMETEGRELVENLEDEIAEKTAGYPQLEGKTAAFMYFTPTDLGTFYVYLTGDPRGAFLTDLGLSLPANLETLDGSANTFSTEISAENVDQLMDLDLIIAYGDDALLKTLQEDPRLGTLPAVKNGAVVVLENNTPLAAASTPSALSIPATLDEYLSLLGEAADKVK